MDSQNNDQLVIVCVQCGGIGWLPDPKLAIINGVPQTIDTGKHCPTCNQEGRVTGSRVVGFNPPV